MKVDDQSKTEKQAQLRRLERSLDEFNKRIAPQFRRVRMTRRQALSRIGASVGMVAAGSALGSCSSGQSTSAKSPPTLTSGYIPILDCVPLIVAYEKGFFKDMGIKADKPILIRQWPALLEAFTSKSILLTHILLPQVIFLRYAQEVPVKSVAFNHTNVVAMMLAKGIPNLQALGGKSVGCPTWWAPHTGIFQDVLIKAGLTPVAGKSEKELAPDEVLFRVVPPPDMVEGLKSGLIAGCTVSEPFGAAAEVLADATLAKTSGDVWPNHPCCQSVLLEDTLSRDPEWSRSLTAALYKAALWAKLNREELAELLGKDGGGYFPMPVAVVKRALLKNDLETYGPKGTGAIMHTDWNVKRVDFNPYPYASAFDVTVDMMKRMTVDKTATLPESFRSLTGEQVAKQIVDYDLAKEGLKLAGGIDAFIEGADGELEREQQYEVLLKPVDES